MATGDMIARLLLDSKDFEKNIKKSKKQADDFGTAGQKTGATVAAAFTKITAVLAAIKAAQGVFNAFINSSQTLADGFARHVESAKGAAENFVYSLASADFSSFNGGIDSMIDRLREAYDAFDQLANTKISASFANALDEARFNEAMAIVKDKDATPEARREAMERARGLVGTISETAAKVEQDAFSALQKMFSAKAGVSSSIFTEDLLEGAFRVDLRGDYADVRARIESDYKAYQEQRRLAQNTIAKSKELYKEKYGHNYIWQVADAQQTKNFEALRSEAKRLVAEDIERIDKENAAAITNYIALERLTDEALNDAMEVFNTAVSARNLVANKQVTLAKQQRLLDKDIEKAKEDAAAAAEEQQKAAEAAAKAASEWQAITRVADVGPLAGIKYAKTSTKLPGSIAMLDENPAARAQKFYMSEWLKPFEEDAKRLEDINGVVGMLSGSFASLGSNIEGTAGNMLTFVGSMLDAVQAIIPFIGYLQAEAVMHNVNASAAAKEAAAKTLSAYSSIPFAGIALGVAGVAAIVGAMQSIPKFAEGGIVNRATLGVFGEAGPEAVMPLDKLDQYIQPRELRVTGNIKASGKELVVVLDNYNRVRNG